MNEAPYSGVALGVECALPPDLDLPHLDLGQNRGGGRVVTGKEDRDTEPALPARFGNFWEDACRKLCW
jgi:hypothetical protein